MPPTSTSRPAGTRWTGGSRRGLERPGLRTDLRAHLLALPTDQANGGRSGRSRETTTHFAWCLRDRPDEPFTFWLHEYKEQRDWRAGYADSVHNHRYHFCTTILRGGYQHERYWRRSPADTALIASTELLTSTPCPVGASDSLLASDFHRIPRAVDGTMTFLVKSREVTPWSLSYDPSPGGPPARAGRVAVVGTGQRL